MRSHRIPVSKFVLATITVVSCSWASLTSAEEMIAAVATNFTAPMKQLIDDFQKRSGDRVKASYGSSGKLLAQIQNGAPFDVFLSADQAKPQRLLDAGTAVSGSRFTYALGQLVLWSAAEDKNVEQQLKTGQFNKLAIANPRLAPYGLAAEQTLSGLGLTAASNGKKVMGENIGQAWQFTATGNAELGFVALSQVYKDGKISRGSGWIIDSSLYQPIRQDAVLLQHGANSDVASKFLDYLQSDEAAAIIESWGYRLPPKQL